MWSRDEMMLGGARSTAVRGKGIKLCIVLFFKIDFSLFCVCVRVVCVCTRIYTKYMPSACGHQLESDSLELELHVVVS